ncbi:MAG: BamA/TamA family outer membrane protein [Bacteroidota bacterium]
MKQKILSALVIFLLHVGFCKMLFAQEANVLRSIEFEGLKKNKETYLATRIESRPGQVINDSLITEDVQRLKNTIGIGQATARLDTSLENNNTHLIFTVQEVRTLLPIINFGGVTDNLWFQIGFKDINWLGKGHNLTAFYQNNDGRHTGEVFYRIPQFLKSNWGGSASFRRWASQEPLFFPEGTVNYDYTNTSIALSAIRNFGFHRQLEFGGSVFVENYRKSEEQFLSEPPGPAEATETKTLLRLDYREDFLKYDFFYQSGLTWSLTAQNVYSVTEQVWFNSLQFNAREYIRLGKKINLAIRFQAGIATNNDTPFAPFVADNFVNLRGVGNRIDRGTAQVVLNTEFRQTVLHTPKWGIQLVAFSDIGTWRNPGGQLDDLISSENFKTFFGGGVRIIYPKVHGAVIRIDYGVGAFNKQTRGLVVGFGQYF